MVSHSLSLPRNVLLISSALDRLDTDMQRGLNEEEVKKRRGIAGWNELESKRENMFVKFLSFFTVSLSLPAA